MKIIDFQKKGNVVKFYLGEDDLEKYGGDDWNDTPYEHNAGEVYPEYVSGIAEVYFPFEYVVLEPRDGCLNSPVCKDDMKARITPCIVVAKEDENTKWIDEHFYKLAAYEKTRKFYFGDTMRVGRYVWVGNGVASI